MEKRTSVFVMVVVLLYALFTTGFIFEMVKSSNVGEMDTPYAIAFSNDRLGLIGIYNDDDIECAKWLVRYRQDDIPIKTDYFGYMLIVGQNGIGTGYYKNVVNPPYYLFLGSWNHNLGKIVLGWDAGVRIYEPLPDVLGMKEIHRDGKAVVYEVD